jgi:hypothetical protein
MKHIGRRKCCQNSELSSSMLTFIVSLNLVRLRTKATDFFFNLFSSASHEMSLLPGMCCALDYRQRN